MADKTQNDQSSRRSRKDVLLSRREQEQYNQIRLIGAIVVAFLAVVLIAGLVVEYIVLPNRAVATVNDERITLRDWEKRVHYERSQLIDYVQSIYTLFEEDTSQVLQFAGQQVNLLVRDNAEILGEQVLQQMIDETLLRQEAVARGITVSDTDVQARIESQFNYFDGAATREPTPTATVEPTPSVTPIGADSAETPTEEAPAGDLPPTATPFPTATPVTAEGFETLFEEDLGRVESAGADEAVYREAVTNQLYIERFRDSFLEEIATEEEQVSLFVISYGTEQEALQGVADIATNDFLTTWNTIRSSPRVTVTQPTATELNWSTVDDVTSRLGPNVADAAFNNVPVGDQSDVIADQATPEAQTRYYIIEVRGREVRPLPDAVIDGDTATLLTDWLEEARLSGGVVRFDNTWQGRAPVRPVLDPVYYQAPEPVAPDTPVQP